GIRLVCYTDNSGHLRVPFRASHAPNYVCTLSNLPSCGLRNIASRGSRFGPALLGRASGYILGFGQRQTCKFEPIRSLETWWAPNNPMKTDMSHCHWPCKGKASANEPCRLSER